MEKMTLSPQGVMLIQAFEGCKLTAYKPVKTEKYWTIGYGHYGADVSESMTITQKRAEELFRQDIKPIETALNKMGINFRQEQFDALVSWIYNLGLANFKKSTMYKYIVGDMPDICITDQMVKWVNAGGKPLLGLKRRRTEEANMFGQSAFYYLDERGDIKRK